MILRALLLAAAFIAADTAEAATTTYTSRAAWEAVDAVTDSQTLTFEGVASDSTPVILSTPPPAGVQAPYTIDGVQFGPTPNSEPTVFGINGGLLPFADTDLLAWQHQSGTAAELLISFPGLVNAFGVDLGELFGTATQFTIELHRFETAVDEDDHTFVGSAGELAFFGLTSDAAFHSVSISALGASLLDNVSYQLAPVPEPGAVALVLLGIAGVLRLRRRTAAA